MANDMLQRPSLRMVDDNAKARHECAGCGNKERVYLTSPNGRQTAAVWRCRTLSQKTQREVLVQPHENCFEHRSLSDHWAPTNVALVR